MSRADNTARERHGAWDAVRGDHLSGGGAIEAWKRRARQLKGDTYALYLAYRDPRVPWYAKACTAFVVAYAFSPIDLIPDFIPVLGYVDDLVLVPLGLMLALRMIPTAVWEECRERAREMEHRDKPTSWLAAGVILAIWLLSVAIVFVVVLRVLRR
jgi:uncharacterized membrane protein YkvA (DUF1232 family)